MLLNTVDANNNLSVSWINANCVTYMLMIIHELNWYYFPKEVFLFVMYATLKEI